MGGCRYGTLLRHCPQRHFLAIRAGEIAFAVSMPVVLFLVFHALRTAYINFVLDVAPDVKTAQELARHETANLTLNTYGRAKEERCRAVVESVGNLVFNDGLRDAVDTSGQQNRTIFAQGFEILALLKAATFGEAEGCDGKTWCEREDLKRLLVILRGLQDSGQQASIVGHFTIQLGHFQDVTNIRNVQERSKNDISDTDAGKNANRYITEHGQQDADGFYTASQPVTLLPDLLELIDMWATLPDTLRAGIMAMVRTVSSQ